MPTNLPSVEVSVAVFDVDKTLTVRDCVVPFVTRVAGRPKVIATILRNFPTVFSLVKKRDRDGLKEFFVRQFFAGQSVEGIEDLGVVFASKIANQWIRKDVADRLRWHQSEGHLVVLVSASLSPYLLPFGDLIEADAVLCTMLEESDGLYTGNLIGANCRGAEKVSRITQWCAESGLSVSNVQYAYGDSHGDEPMLAMAQHGVWVGKKDLEVVPS